MTMSAKRRSKNLKGSQISLNHEMSFRSGSPGGLRAQSGLSKKSAWLDDVDDVDYAPAKQVPTGMEAEPYSMQTVITADHRADARTQPVGCWKRFARGVRGKGLNRM